MVLNHLARQSASVTPALETVPVETWCISGPIFISAERDDLVRMSWLMLIVIELQMSIVDEKFV